MAKIVTDEHFYIVQSEFSSLDVTDEQREKILETVNVYLLRQIKNTPLKGKKRFSWHMKEFTYTEAFMKHSYHECLSLQQTFTEKIEYSSFYTDKTFKNLMKTILPGTRVIVDKVYSHREVVNVIFWINYVIDLLLRTCITALQNVGFEKMFDTEEMIDFFGAKEFIDKTEVDEQYKGKDLFFVLRSKYSKKNAKYYEFLEGIPYTNRIQFLFNLVDFRRGPESLFEGLKIAAECYDV